MHLRHALAAAAVISAVGCSTAIAGPPPPPRVAYCQDVCQVPNPNLVSDTKQWVSDVRTWATSSPTPPHLTQCSDACLPDPQYFVQDTKRFEGDVTEWLLP